MLPLFTLYLSPADYGILAILGLISFVVTSIFSLGITGAAGVCYYSTHGQDCKEQTIWTSFFILAGSTAVIIFCALAFSGEISQFVFQSAQHKPLVSMVLLSAGAAVLTSPLMLYFQFEEKVKLFVVLTFLSSIISIGISCILVIYLEQGVYGMVESTLISGVISLLLFAYFTFSELQIKTSSKVFRELLTLGIPLVPAFAMLFILQHGNKYILQYLTDFSIVGVYNIGFNIGLVMSLLVSALQSAWLPYFMSFTDKREEARILFGRILTYYVFGFGSISLFFYIYAKPVVMILTQPAFYDAYKVIGLSAGASFVSGVFFILLPGVYFAKQVKYITLIQTVSAIVAVILNIIFIRLFGLLGAAIALISGFVVMALCMQFWNHLQKENYLQVEYEWKRIVQFSLVYIIYATSMLWERKLSLSGELFVSIVATLLLPCIIYVLLKPAEKDYLKHVGRTLRSGDFTILRALKWNV